jgi:uncharacterized protein (UPF0332 family)
MYSYLLVDKYEFLKYVNIMKLNGKLKRYVTLQEKYLKEADEFLEQKNYSQVSEKLWGATATITKAIAASRNKTIRSHDGVAFYLASISKELKDKSILDIVSIANSMHQNFYEDNLPPEVIQRASQKIKQFVNRMRNKFQLS